MKFDGGTEVSFTFKESVEIFLTCCIYDKFFKRFSLVQLLTLASVCVVHNNNSLYLCSGRSTLHRCFNNMVICIFHISSIVMYFYYIWDDFDIVLV